MGRTKLIFFALLALSIPAFGQRAPRVSATNALVDPTEAQFKVGNHMLMGTIRQAEVWDDFQRSDGTLVNTSTPSGQAYNFVQPGMFNTSKIVSHEMVPTTTSGVAFYAQLQPPSGTVRNYGATGRFTGANDAADVGCLILTDHDSSSEGIGGNLLHIFWTYGALTVEITNVGVPELANLSGSPATFPQANGIAPAALGDLQTVSVSISGNQVTILIAGQTFIFYDTTGVLSSASWNTVIFEQLSQGSTSNVWNYDSLWINSTDDLPGVASQPKSTKLDHFAVGNGAELTLPNIFTAQQTFGGSSFGGADNGPLVSEFGTLQIQGTDHSNNVGGLVFAPASTYRNYRFTNALFADDFALYVSTGASMGYGSWKTSPPLTPVLYFDAPNSRFHIGTMASNAAPTGSGDVVVHGVLHIVPQATPGTASEGDIYVNSSDHHTYEYNGTAWKQLDN